MSHRYKATWEFELKFTADYSYVRDAFIKFTENLSEGYPSVKSDYATIEKIGKER